MKRDLLEFRHLEKVRCGQSVLNDVSLHLYEGEITFFLGRSTGGVSDTRLILSGQERPSEGSIFLKGEAYRPNSPADACRRGVYCVGREIRLMPNLTIGENICITQKDRLFHQPKREEARLQMMCRETGIQLPLREQARNGSMIDLLMVYCLRMLLVRADLLVLDHVLYLLSTEEIRELFEKLELLKARNMGILVIDSDAHWAQKYADRTFFFRHGRLLASFGANEFTKEHAQLLLETGKIPEMIHPQKDVGGDAPRIFRYIDGTEARTLQLRLGSVSACSCHDTAQYQKYLDLFSQRTYVEQRNPLARVITLQSLQSEYFYNLSFQENVAIGAYGRLIGHGVNHTKQAERFIRQETSAYFPGSVQLWARDAQQIGDLEREIAVLYRTLMQTAEILFFVGVLDLQNNALEAELWKVIASACALGKSVLLFTRDIREIRDHVDQVFYLDEGAF